MIWRDIRLLAYHLWQQHGNRFVLTSGGFDCLHVGHLRLLQDSKSLGYPLVVVVNGDGFLMRKKGYVFMPIQERMEVIDGVRGVDYVVAWDDGTQFVDGAIRILRPGYYTKGGDRSTLEAIAPCELRACREVGCRVLLGVGGVEKAQSSSRLVAALPRK